MTSFEAQWRRRFEEFAQDYDSAHLVSGWSELGFRYRFHIFREILSQIGLPPGGRVLDLGCSAGTHVRLLLSSGYRTVGLDYSIPSLRRAVDAAREPNHTYVAGEAYNLPFSSASFDLVVSIGVMQTLSQPEWALGEMIRVLRPDGHLFFEFLNANEITALARKTCARARGKPLRLQTYTISRMEAYLQKRSLRIARRIGIYLLPRPMKALSMILSMPALRGFLDRIQPLPCFATHAFFLLARKF